jgi:peptidoglycan/LPS O-acetylase OafA/YrhL
MGLLRLLLALAVVLAHLPVNGGWNWMSGRQAVQLFFILSGFYMALVLHEKYPKTPAGCRAFLWARAMRLFPAYWVVLCGAVAAYALIGPASVPGAPNWFRTDVSVGPLTGLVLSAANVFILGQDALLFTQVENGALVFAPDLDRAVVPAYSYLVIPPAWSISVELMFYAIAPWVVRRSWFWLLGLFGASVALRAWIKWGLGFDHDPWGTRFFPTCLMFFLMGAMVYRWLPVLRRQSPPAILKIVPFGAIATVVFWPFIVSRAGSVVQLALVTASLPLAMYWWGRNRVDRWIGELSYPVYIAHWPVLLVAVALGVRSPLAQVAWVFAVALLIQCAVERPLERFRQRRIARLTQTAA